MKASAWGLLLVGLVARFALAPLADHPYDMAIWAYYQRIFYNSGNIDFRYFPTLPVIYYAQLASYSFYTLLTFVGLNDPLVFYHTNYAIEGIFLKLPMILADVGVFLLFIRSGKPLPAALYFLNPLTIYLSAAWGTYDSIMMFFLVAGFLALQRDKRLVATLFFSVCGLVKLFGFVPLALLVIESLTRRRFKEMFRQFVVIGSTSLVTLAPIIIQGGVQNFVIGFALRFLGASGARTATWNIFAAIQGSKFEGAPPYIWLAYALVPIPFVRQLRRTNSVFLPALQSSTIGAILLNIFSQAEPQWLSWPIPLALLYASVTKKSGLGFFTYSFGAIATFLIMTLTQGTGYVLFGLPYTSYLSPLEGFSNTLAVYAVTTLSLLLLLVGYVIAKPVKFKFEAIALILIIYCQAYFWFNVVNIQRVLGIAL